MWKCNTQLCHFDQSHELFSILYWMYGVGHMCMSPPSRAPEQLSVYVVLFHGCHNSPVLSWKRRQQIRWSIFVIDVGPKTFTLIYLSGKLWSPRQVILNFLNRSFPILGPASWETLFFLTKNLIFRGWGTTSTGHYSKTWIYLRAHKISNTSLTEHTL